MAYEVLARKWRPQRFEDVVGQDHVVQTLRNAIETKRLAHAYLFVGSRGIGKTSIARIFARALNCQKGPTVTPCGTCDACREIATGSNLDVLEIDGASNNGVDQVRDLRETVRYAPSRGPFKITIIDEVHMLSVAAFNALLKTLEEPPQHAKFIFATTEPQKIPATVLSRVQRFDLRRIPVGQIVERLRTMAAAENVTISDDALLAIARGAEGGMRDAQSALDQLISFRGNTINEEDVLSVFGLVARGNLEALAAAVLAGDVPGLLRQVGELDRAGKDLQRLVVELMEHFRNLLVLLNVQDRELHADLTDAQLEVLKRQAEKADTSRVLRIVGVLTETEDRLRFALSRRTLLETALIRCARAATVVSLEEVLTQIQALRAGLGGGPAPESGGGRFTEAPLQPGSGAVARPVVREAAPPPPAAGGHAAGKLNAEKWPGIQERAAKDDPMNKVFWHHTRLLAAGETAVEIGFNPDCAHKGSTGRDPGKILQRILRMELGMSATVTFVPAEAEAPAAPPTAEPPPAMQPTAPSADTAPGAKGKSGKGKQDWTKDPTVSKALEMFNGSIIDVKE